MKKTLSFFILIFSFFQGSAQGTWSVVMNLAPRPSGGLMTLLSDGTVLSKSAVGGWDKSWDRLTPDSLGRYAYGTWDTIANMQASRLYFSSQLLKDGRLYVGGGEYGTDTGVSEIYDPLVNTWTPTKPLPTGDLIYDGESKQLPDGKILQAIQFGPHGGNAVYIFDPLTNSYIPAPPCLAPGGTTESSWVKLPDESILMIDWHTNTSERYIPSLNSWVTDAIVPVTIWDWWSTEIGPGVLLPNGKVFFIGGSGATVYYTPSGSSAPGTWTAGPSLPSGQGAIDAAAAMMIDGKILCAASPIPTMPGSFPSPTRLYEFDYISNTFTPISWPGFGSTDMHPCNNNYMLDLPDGTVLFSTLNSRELYIYTPAGMPLASGKPVINNLLHVACDTYKVTGTLFNGISEGAYYGDDAQMSTNFPIVRLKKGTRIFYARSFNWNRTGVMTGSLADTVTFTLPSGLPAGKYDLEVVANGIPSTTYSLVTCGVLDLTESDSELKHKLTIYPDPASVEVTIDFNIAKSGVYEISLINMYGKVVKKELGFATLGQNVHLLQLYDIPPGLYTIRILENDEVYNAKFLVK